MRDHTKEGSLRFQAATYVIASAALFAAIAARWLLDGFLGNSSILVTVYGAVAVAVWAGGYRPAVLVAALGYLACHFLFLEPRGTFDWSTAKDTVGLMAYLFTCSLLIAIGEAMRLAQRRSRERGELLQASLAEQQKFVTLVENSTDFIGMCDLAGVPFYVNPAGLKMVGLESVEQARRTHVREFFLPGDQARIMDEFFPSVMEKGHGEIEVRFRNFRTGGTVWMAYKVLALTDAAGRKFGFATVSQDVSERRRLEDSLRTMASDLSEADRRKDEFLAMLAHELRNPLAPLLNAVHLLKWEGSNGANGLMAVEMMERQVKQLVRLVDDLLDVSRIKQDRLELRKGRTELATVIEQAVHACTPLAQSARHELLVCVPPQPVHLYADSARLIQVFANLLNNACKYTAASGRILLHAERQGSYAVVTVEDNGIGIPHDKLERIFDMFTQVDQSCERSRSGLGIGLTLAKRLVQMHGGSIEASSPGEGLGSKFVVRLPAMDAPELRRATASRSDVRTPTRRILVVDDNQDGADALAALLRLQGHETFVAHDGSGALAAAESHRPELVLLDIGLPLLDGYEVCRRIREHPWGRNMRLVALTGWSQEEDRCKSGDAGFDGHLVKPVSDTALASLLAPAAAEIPA